MLTDLQGWQDRIMEKERERERERERGRAMSDLSKLIPAVWISWADSGEMFQSSCSAGWRREESTGELSARTSYWNLIREREGAEE